MVLYIVQALTCLLGTNILYNYRVVWLLTNILANQLNVDIGVMQFEYLCSQLCQTMSILYHFKI